MTTTKKSKTRNIDLPGRRKVSSVRDAIKNTVKELEELHLVVHDKIKKGT